MKKSKFSKLFNTSHQGPLQLEFFKSSFSDQTICQAFFKTQESEPGVAIHHTQEKAAMAAMGEALERHCLAVTRSDDFDRSYKELVEMGLPAFEPKAFRFFSKEQDVIRSGEASFITARTKLDWAWFTNPLDSGRKILIPSKANQFFNLKQPLYYASSSSGGACGETKLGAQAKSILELLERDAVMVYWWTRNTPLKIDLADMRESLNVFDPILPYVQLYYLKTDFQIPIVMAVLARGENKHLPKLMMTAAAHFSPTAAIEKALGEMSQSLHMLSLNTKRFSEIQFGQNYDDTIWSFQDHVGLYAFSDLPKAYQFLFPSKSQRVKIQELPNLEKLSDERGLSYLLKEFQKNQIRIFLRDNTTNEIKNAGFRVYRAFSPDLVPINGMHKFRQLGCPRLYQLPRKLGLDLQPDGVQDLNPFPHPFP